MVQTTFSVDNAGSLATVLADIGSGTDAATNTAYTITMTAGVSLTASVSLEAGSSVTLDSPFPFTAPAFAVTGTVVTNLDFTGTITLDNGVLDNPALSTNSGGTIVAGLFSGTVLGTTGDAGDTVINDGTILSDGTYAAIEFESGTVQNGWNGPAAGLISGVPGGVFINAAGLVQNGGTIIGSASTSVAVFLAAGTVDNGQIGDTAALMSGGATGVDIAGAGAVNNDGTITGVAYDAVYLGSGSVTNGQIGATSALINGGPAGNGVWIGAGAGAVGNDGTIIGEGASGVYLELGGIVTNGASSDATALINGAGEGVLFGAAGSLLNYGTVQANGSDASQPVIGAFFEAGGTIANSTTSALIAGLEWGAVVEGGAGFVTNLGTIEATAESGLGIDLTAGGTVVNGITAGADALILGGSNAVADGVRISAGDAGTGAVVVNDGTIEGTVGVDFQSGATEAAGTLTNAGLIESTSGASGYAVVFGTGTERLVLQSTGTFVGGVLGSTDPGSSTTLELAAGTQGTLTGLADNTGTVTDSAGSFAFSDIGTIALDAGASWTLTAPGTLSTLDNAGTLVIDGATEAVVSPLLTGAGQIQLSNGGDLELDVGSIPSGQTIVFDDATDTLDVGSIGGFDAAIQGFTPGDTIIVDTASPATFHQSGSVVSVIENGTTLGGLTFASAQMAQTAVNTSGALVDHVLCFLAGTLVKTPSGQTAVERLAVGDRIVTVGGKVRPVTWIGMGRVLATRGRRNAATPVIVRKGALAPNIPHQDLRVTKGHSLYLDGVLIPVEFLVNHRSILWDDRAQEVSLYHIELETHDVLVANGAPAESYRDDGNRWLFWNANTGWDQAPKPPCAAVLTGGPQVDAVWRRLLDRAGARPSVPLTADPDLHLVANGVRVDAATRTGDAYVFRLGEKPGFVRVVSRAAAPQELGLARDPRCLGVAVRQLAVRQGTRFRLVHAEDRLLAEGFHAFEAGTGLRWTDGEAALPETMFAGFTGPVEVVVHVGARAHYIDEGVMSAVA